MKMIMKNRLHKETQIDLDIDTNIQNITSLGEMLSICNKQYFKLNSLKS